MNYNRLFCVQVCRRGSIRDPIMYGIRPRTLTIIVYTGTPSIRIEQNRLYRPLRVCLNTIMLCVTVCRVGERVFRHREDGHWRLRCEYS